MAERPLRDVLCEYPTLVKALTSIGVVSWKALY
jgi:hypothetical protein